MPSLKVSNFYFLLSIAAILPIYKVSFLLWLSQVKVRTRWDLWLRDEAMDTWVRTCCAFSSNVCGTACSTISIADPSNIYRNLYTSGDTAVSASDLLHLPVECERSVACLQLVSVKADVWMCELIRSYSIVDSVRAMWILRMQREWQQQQQQEQSLITTATCLASQCWMRIAYTPRVLRALIHSKTHTHTH